MNAAGNAAWLLVRLPLTILLVGGAALLVLKGAAWSGLFGGLAFQNGQVVLVAFLVFAVGLAVGGFLWWLARESFVLLREKDLDSTRLAMIKDLPLGLPEGTVRAVLALIVGLVGLPLLLFSATLSLTDQTIALVANIITAAFAFYFGQRSNSADAQTAKTLTGAVGGLQAEKTKLAADNAALVSEKTGLLGANVALADAAATGLGGRLGSAIDDLGGVVGTGQALLQIAGAVLPAGTLPAGLPALLEKASNIAAGAKALVEGPIDADTIAHVADTAGSVLGQSGLGGMLRSAAGALLPIAGIGAGPAGLAALVVSVGWQLGSGEYRRWRARILDAPYETALISPGLITVATVAARLPQCPVFNQAFGTQAGSPAFCNTLIDDVLADDADDRLWSKYGHDSSLFANREILRQGLLEFRMALLADQSARDVTDAAVAAVAKTLNAGGGDFRPGEASATHVTKVLDARITPTAPHSPTAESIAALQALVLLVGRLRESKTDIAPMIARLA